ncbi:MAG: hypothetical protein HS122_03250 [Opitutaceae bacterium]|nr:hypothetical protein [Opitutaceae bacterium]
MSVLKRLGADMLRMGAKKRQRVIWVWDRAGIDFELWQNWKALSRVTEFPEDGSGFGQGGSDSGLKDRVWSVAGVGVKRVA